MGTGAELLTFPGPQGDSQTRVAAFSPYGALVVTGGTTRAGKEGAVDEGWATVWDTTTGAAIHELISPTPGVVPNEAAFSPEGSHLALAEDHKVRVWDTTTCSATRRGVGGPRASATREVRRISSSPSSVVP